MKKVSVIIPVYNTEKWVEECIRSIQNGGYDNLEIIVVDDGSKDNSRVIINRLMDNDPRIIYMHKRNSGAAAARESGIKISTGDYLMFVDSDDYIEKGSIGEMVRRAEEENCDMVFSDYIILYNSSPSAIFDMNPKGVDVSTGMNYLRHRIECYMWMKLFRRELLNDIVQQKSPVCEDLYLLVQILPRCKKVAYIKKPLYYYRQTEHSVMRASRQRAVGEWLGHALEMRALLSTLSLPKEINNLFFYENIHTIYRFIKEGDRNDKVYRKRLRELIHSTFKEMKIGTVNSLHRLKLIIFLTVVHFVYGK